MANGFIEVLRTWGTGDDLVRLTMSNGQIVTGAIEMNYDDTAVALTGPAVRKIPDKPGRFAKYWGLAAEPEETWYRTDAIVGVSYLGEA